MFFMAADTYFPVIGPPGFRVSPLASIRETRTTLFSDNFGSQKEPRP